MKNTKDMTTGNPLTALILFSLPLILGNLFQHFYNLMDITIVGNSLGEHSLAAVGATSPVNGLYLSLAFGFTNGFSLIIAKHFGAKNIKKLKRAIAGSVKISIITSIILTVTALFTTKSLLVLLHTTDVNLSYQYISVVFLCLTFTIFYNLFSGILRAVGNSLAPLIFLIIGTFTNIGLDFLFINGLHLGVFGAGLATAMAQGISCIISGLFLLKKCAPLLPGKEDYKPDRAMIRELLGGGIAMGLMFSIVSIGSITLQFAVNNLGDTTVAAHTTARKIDEMMMMVFFPLSTAAATFSSQNLGAGKVDRIHKGLLTAFAISITVSLIMLLTTFFYGEDLVAKISGSSNPELIRLGSTFLKYNIPFYFFLIILVILRSTLQGLGNKVLPICASIVELVSKIVFALVFVPRMGYMGVIICEPIIWFLGAVIVGAGFIYTLVKLNKNAGIETSGRLSHIFHFMHAPRLSHKSGN